MQMHIYLSKRKIQPDISISIGGAKEIDIAVMVFQYTSELQQINTICSAHNLILQVDVVDPILSVNRLHEPGMCYKHIKRGYLWSLVLVNIVSH